MVFMKNFSSSHKIKHTTIQIVNLNNELWINMKANSKYFYKSKNTTKTAWTYLKGDQKCRLYLLTVDLLSLYTNAKIKSCSLRFRVLPILCCEVLLTIPRSCYNFYLICYGTNTIKKNNGLYNSKLCWPLHLNG